MTDTKDPRRTYRGYASPDPNASSDAAPDGEADGGEGGAMAAPKTIPDLRAPKVPRESKDEKGSVSAKKKAEAVPKTRPPDADGPTTVADRTPLVEIEVVHEHGPAPSTERPWRTVEVWTRNRVYTLDSKMECVEVKDRASRKLVEDHPFLGLRLVGGQHRDGETIELSFPFPRPGTEAVFEKQKGNRGSFSRTSAVTRVILRLHIMTVQANHVVPTWGEITGAFNAPKITKK